MFQTGPLSIIRSISTLYTQQYMVVLLASASRQPAELAWQIPTAVYTVLRYSWWWTVNLSETCRVLYQINFRNSASCWLLLQEHITMHGPVNVKYVNQSKVPFITGDVVTFLVSIAVYLCLCDSESCAEVHFVACLVGCIAVHMLHLIVQRW
jgi:hypothetical protein